MLPTETTTVYHNRHVFRPWRVLSDFFYTHKWIGSRTCDQGENVSSFAAAVMPNQPLEETQASRLHIASAGSDECVTRSRADVDTGVRLGSGIVRVDMLANINGCITVDYTRTIEATAAYDLVVCGGGPAGCCAALSARREGLSVLLVESQAQLGGSSTSMIGRFGPDHVHHRYVAGAGKRFRHAVSRSRSRGQAATGLSPWTRDLRSDGEPSTRKPRHGETPPRAVPRRAGRYGRVGNPISMCTAV